MVSMSDAMSIALSGMNLNTKRVAVSANNIANMTTTGPVANPGAAYQPQRVEAVSAGEAGGVAGIIKNNEPATSPAYSPSDPNANADGLVAMPNVSLEQEMVTQMTSVIGYKANAEVIKTANAMDRALLDITV